MTPARIALPSVLLLPFLFLVAEAPRAAPLSAQPVLAELPVGTRSLGLGTAVPLADRDPDGIFHNPALLARGRGIGASAHRYRGGATLLSASAARPWGSGGVGLGLRTVSYGLPEAGEAAAPPRDLPRGEGRLLPDGPLTRVESGVSAGYARAVRGLRLGATASFLEVRAEGSRDAVLFLDLGAAYEVGPVTLGVAGGGLGPDLRILGRVEELPRRVTAGVGTRAAPVGPLDVAGAASVTRRGDGERISAAGVEVRWWPVQGRTFAARIGIRETPGFQARPLTLGAALLGDAFTVEWAWQGLREEGALHSLSLRWR